MAPLVALDPFSIRFDSSSGRQFVIRTTPIQAPIRNQASISNQDSVAVGGAANRDWAATENRPPTRLGVNQVVGGELIVACRAR
jgi:hypothetical protein